MRIRVLIVIFVFNGFSLLAQSVIDSKKGVVSYISSQNVYVKFETTEKINLGDTLYSKEEGKLIPVLIVRNKSSISCVCTSLTSNNIHVSDEVFTRPLNISEPVKSKDKEEDPQKDNEEKGDEQSAVLADTSGIQIDESEVLRDAVISKQGTGKEVSKQKIRGRLSAASYSVLSNSKNTHRLRYSFSFRGDNLGNTKISFENYIVFRHTLNEWEEVKNNISDALKVYALSIKYDFNNNSNVTIGRKINRKISSMGAIDGIQMEIGRKDFSIGAIAGFRPDYLDYGLNPDLFQYGAFVSHSSNNGSKYLQSTIAFIDQRNRSEIDRRFVYIQHSNSLFKGVNLFSSFEIDLYENINSVKKNVLSFTNMYISLRYRISNKINISGSYDSRKNIIYYESYKSFIDRLIDQETRQGARFYVNYRILKNVILGVNTSLRFKKDKINISRNLNAYLSFTRIPSINLRSTLTGNFIQTSYLNGRIFGVRLSRDIIPGKITSDIYYRKVDYKYLNFESEIHQNIVGANFSITIYKNLSLYTYYEGIFADQNKSYHRINIKIIKRFKE